MNMQSIETPKSYQHRLQTHDSRNKPAILMLTDDGMILESNEIGEKLLDYSPRDTVKKHVSALLPQLADIDLLEKGGERVNPYLRFLSRIGRHFEVTSLQGRQFSGELYFSDINHLNQHLIMIIIYPASHR